MMHAVKVLFASLSVSLSMCAMVEAETSQDEQNPQVVDVPAPQSAIEERADSMLVADPQQVLRLRKKIQQFSAAKQAPIQDDFSGISQEVLDIEEIFELSLDPGAPAPKIFIARYQGSAISFVDAYGNPWPIRKISNFLSGLILVDRAVTGSDSSGATEGGGDAAAQGDAKQGNAKGISINDPQAGSFTVTALKAGVTGNLTVYLEGLSTPISVLLEGKGGIYHRVVTLRINDVGPQSDQVSLLSNSGVAIGAETDVDLNHALYGVGPTGSEEMVIEGGDGKAWLRGNELFVQTPVAVFSPKILRTSPGNGKYRAYKLPATTTILGTNTDGQTVTLKVKRHLSNEIRQETSFKGRSD